MESRITISRTSPEDVQQRQIIVKLDGDQIAYLMYGKTVTHELSPGHHTLSVDNTWNRKKLEFDVAAGEHVRFITFSRAGRFTWFIGSIFGAAPMYVTLEREPV